MITAGASLASLWPHSKSKRQRRYSLNVDKLTLESSSCYFACSMNGIHDKGLMRQGALHGWFAILLLIFASADLSADLVSPQSCCEWIDNLATASAPQQVSFAQVPGDERALVAANEAQPEQSSNPSNVDEDCFCCCAHILPCAHFDVVISHTKPPASLLTDMRLPVPPSQSQFRPPRRS
jgi:hypothetical protein